MTRTNETGPSDHHNDGLGWKGPFLGKSVTALLVSVVFMLTKISLVCTWQSDLSHQDQGPTGDMLTHRAMSCTAVLIRGDKDITLCYRPQGKIKKPRWKSRKTFASAHCAFQRMKAWEQHLGESL